MLNAPLRSPASLWVCLLFAADQVVFFCFVLFLYRFFFENDPMKGVRVNQNSKAVSGQINNKLELTVKLRGAADLVDNSLKVQNYQRLPTHCHTVKGRFMLFSRLVPVEGLLFFGKWRDIS